RRGRERAFGQILELSENLRGLPDQPLEIALGDAMPGGDLLPRPPGGPLADNGRPLHRPGRPPARRHKLPLDRIFEAARRVPARHAGPRRRPDTLGAEGAGHSGERRWIGWKDPRPDRLGEEEHPRMPDPGGEPSPWREPEVAVQVAEIAQDPGAAAEDLDLLI